MNHIEYRIVPPIEQQHKYNDDDHQYSKYCKQNSNPTAAFSLTRGWHSSRGMWSGSCALERNHTIGYEVRFSLAVTQALLLYGGKTDKNGGLMANFEKRLVAIPLIFHCAPCNRKACMPYSFCREEGDAGYFSQLLLDMRRWPLSIPSTL